MAAPQNSKSDSTTTNNASMTPQLQQSSQADKSVDGAQLVTLDVAQLTRLIAGAISEQMQTQASSNTLAADIASGIANSQRRRMTFGEYIQTRGSYYHPDPKKAIKLTRKCFQNGGPIVDSNIHDQEADLLNRLTHSGRYIDRLVEISVRDMGGDEQEVHMSYNSKSAGINAIKERLYRKPGDVTTLATILRMIVDEQELEDLETNEKLEQQAARRVALASAKS